MSDTAVLTDIRSMIDLAIGTPEVGVVDFCMLHTILHLLAQQLYALDKPVELRGSAAQAIATATEGQTVAVTEYIVETTDSEKTMVLKPQPKSDEPTTLLVVERVKRDFPIKRTESPISKGRSYERGGQERDGYERGGREKSRQERIENERGGPGRARQERDSQGKGEKEGGEEETGQERDGQDRDSQERGGHRSPTNQHDDIRPRSSAEKFSLVTLSKFNLLEDAVHDLKNRVYGSMPKNEDILDEVRSQGNMRAITDMWTNLNVSSRLEAAEAGLSKLSSLVEDLIREGGLYSPTDAASRQDLQSAPQSATAQRPAEGHAPAPASQRPHDPRRGSLAAQVQQLRGEVGMLNQAFHAAMQYIHDGLDPMEAVSSIMGPPPVNLGTTPAVSQAQQPASQLEGRSPAPSVTQPAPASRQMDGGRQSPGADRQSAGGGRKPPGADGQASGADRQPSGVERASAGADRQLMDRLLQLEKRVKECCDDRGKDYGTVQDQLNNFQDQLDHITRQVATLHEDFGNLQLSPTLGKDLQGLMNLYETVQDMQNQLRQVNETARLLAGEKDDRQRHMNALLEQIEILKTIKMDREDMAEAMAEKADLRMLARKVSHDQFEIACDDLSRGLEHALGKLNTQESLWQQVLDDIQREIETKLDKMELSPLKDFFNNKLRQLQDNLKQMASLRRDVEAAGTTRRLLRDVNCISCDANAVMAMDNTSIVASKPLPAHFSIKPYLSYELDAIRKTQASNLPQRNLHDWETIDKQMPPKPPVKVRSSVDKHLCNRYCGGSHTTTTPAQRVTRLGHFVKQWGPDVLPLSSGLAAGDDGRLYKVTVNSPEHVKDGAGGVDMTCTKRQKLAERPKSPPKPSVSPECRCLEDGV